MPRKPNPIKKFLRAHSMGYFCPRLQLGADGNPLELPDGRVLCDKDGNPILASDFDVDILSMPNPVDRVNAEIKLLEYHTAKLKAVDVDMDARVAATSIEDTLRVLAMEPDDDDGQDPQSNDEDEEE